MLLFITIAARATEIVVEPLRYAKHLSGQVIDPTGAPVADVSVKFVACGASQFKGHSLTNEEDATRSDVNGRFVIRQWQHKARTCLSFSRDGFNYHQFEVKYRSNAGPIVVKLSIAA
jgi:hypothetical protein